ncbi:MAG: ABC transporter permease, partial [Verrucomicrobiales bacterium]|nr:ABC transporter permease [Verrucomicrobiales bacterium]
MHPFRQVIRQFVKAPGFVAVAVLTLAVGIGAKAVVFGVAKAVLLRPLGLPDEDQLMWVRLTKARASMSEAALSWSEIEDIRESVPSFAAVATYGISGMVWNDHESGFEVPILRARPELMEVLQIRPRLGRLFATEEYVEKSGVALLTYQGWQSHFGGRSEVLGHQVRLDGVVREVVGVLPEGFGFPLERLPVTGTGAGPLVRQGDQVFWVPMAPPQESDRTSREARMFSVAARLKPGATEAGARAELAVLSSRLAVLYPEANRGLGFDVVSFRDFILGRTRQGLPLLGGAVAAVLLVCCVNLANLLLARGLVRQREWAVCLAMGAARTRLIRDSLMESLALALSAGLVGWAMAVFGLRLLRALGSASVPFLEEARVDGWVLLFAVGLSTVTAFVFGALPAWHQSRTDAAEALRTGARSSGGPQIQRWQNALLVGQVAAVLVLTLAAGALLESFRRLLGQDLGYQVDPVVTMTLRTRDFETNGELCRFYRRLRERLAALPGIEAVGTISSVPLTGG